MKRRRQWPEAPHIPLIPPGHVALKYSDTLLLKAYKIVMKMHEQAGQRLATMLVFAAYVIDMHSRMARVDPEETIGLVRNMITKLRKDMPPKTSELPHIEA